MNILITGATGFIGKELGKDLVQRGHRIFAMSRNKQNALLHLPFPSHVIEADLSKEPIRDERLKDIQVVIHLAGENLSESRWTSETKKKIYESRVKSTQNLILSLQDSKLLEVFISTSAIGYYGDREDIILNESSSKGEGFLSQVCQDWEQPLTVFSRKKTIPHLRCIHLRLGVVLSAFDGAFPKMILPFQFGVGAPLGSGKQWMSWIHIQDLVSLFSELIENQKYSGIINAVSPDPVTNKIFSEKLAFELQKRLLPPVPSFILKIIFGELSELLLSSQRVKSEALAGSMKFQFADLETALRDLCRFHKNGTLVFKAEQYLQGDLIRVFPFFCNVHNLEKLTPSLLKFQVQSMSTPKVQGGSLIEYKMKIHKIPVRWVTEIIEWDEPNHFIDVQKKGPYSKWHHIHTFQGLGSGTMMTDLVQYKLPFGKLGLLFAGAFVKKDIKEIFLFRRKVISEEGL